MFWGWRAIILSAAISLPLGYTTSKSTRSWVAYRHRHRRGLGELSIVFRHRVKRTTPHLCGELVLRCLHHHHRRAAHRQQHGMPVSPGMKSYSMYAGRMDAMVQWWYGHNAVGFFLTAGFLG